MRGDIIYVELGTFAKIVSVLKYVAKNNFDPIMSIEAQEVLSEVTPEIFSLIHNQENGISQRERGMGVGEIDKDDEQ